MKIYKGVVIRKGMPRKKVAKKAAEKKEFSRHFQTHHIKGKLIYLMVSLFVLLLSYPFLHNGTLGKALLNVLLTFVLLSGIYVVTKHKQQRVIAILLGLPWLILSWSGIIFGIDKMILTTNIFGVIFYTFTVVTVFLYVIHAKKVTVDVLYGAVSVYLLIGLMWTSIYSLLEIINPGSIVYIGVNSPVAWGDLLYFSYMTLTTVGYGELIPITDIARSLSLLEAVIGVMFVTVLLARLVGVYVTHTTRAAFEDLEDARN